MKFGIGCFLTLYACSTDLDEDGFTVLTGDCNDVDPNINSGV